MTRIVVLTVLLLAATAGGASAAQRGRSFLNDPVNSAAEYADRIRTCVTRAQMQAGEISPYLNLSCEALVESFNELPYLDEVRDHLELASYVETLSIQPCPPPGRDMRIAMVESGDRVGYFVREFREGERCLADLSQNLYVSSGICGQWFETLLPFSVVTTTAPAPPAEAPRLDVDRAVREEVERQLASRAPTPIVVDNRNWLERNWPWAVPVGAAVAVGIACAFDHCPFMAKQKTNVVVGAGAVEAFNRR